MSTKIALISGCEWHFEYYCDDVYGATHFDRSKNDWAYVLFAREGRRREFSAVDHDSGFQDQSTAVTFLRRAAHRRT